MLDEEQKSYEWILKLKSSIFGNACRVNHLKESFENQSEDGVTNVMQTCCGLKEIGMMVMES